MIETREQMLARGAVLLIAFVAAAAAQDATPPTPAPLPVGPDAVWTSPKLMLVPGLRFGETAPAGANLKNGGQRFDLDFLLRDGCRACLTVGLVKVAFEFDVNGRFVGTEIGRVRARR